MAQIKGLLSGLPISKATQKSIEDGLTDYLGKRADEIQSMGDLKKAVFESLAKIPIMDAKGILYAKSLDELAKRTFGDQFDVAEKISNAIADEIAPPINNPSENNIPEAEENTSEKLDIQINLLKDIKLDDIKRAELLLKAAKAEKKLREQEKKAEKERSDNNEQLMTALLKDSKNRTKLIKNIKESGEELNYWVMNEDGSLVRSGVKMRTGNYALDSLVPRGGIKSLIKFGGVLALATDALEGIADPALQGNSIVSRGAASMITGGTNGTVTGNALKGAAIGAFAGPLGMAIGAAIGGALAFIDTKWLADTFDGAFEWLADIDWQGMMQKIWDLPATIDEMAGKLWENVKWLAAKGWDVVSTLFTGEFWSGVWDLFTSTWGEQIALLGDMVGGVVKPIWDFISAPFTGEFWMNGKDGVFDKAGDLGVQIAESLGNKIVEVRDNIIAYLAPNNWLPDWVTSKEVAKDFVDSGVSIAGAMDETAAFQGYDVVSTPNQTIKDIEGVDSKMADQQAKQRMKDLSNAYNIATSTTVNNNASVQINNRNQMGPTATHARLSYESYGR